MSILSLNMLYLSIYCHTPNVLNNYRAGTHTYTHTSKGGNSFERKTVNRTSRRDEKKVVTNKRGFRTAVTNCKTWWKKVRSHREVQLSDGDHKTEPNRDFRNRKHDAKDKEFFD